MRKIATAFTAPGHGQHEAAHHHLDRSSRFYSGFFVPVRHPRHRRGRAMKYWSNLALALIQYAFVAITFAAAAGVIAGLIG